MGKNILIAMGLWAQNLGIGTPTPTEKLHISGGLVRVEGLSGTNPSLVGITPAGVLQRIEYTGSTNDVLLGTCVFAPDPTDWKLLGNANTGVSNYVGTANATQFAIRTNNTQRMRFFVDGKILVNTTSPPATTALLQIDAGNNHRGLYAYKNTTSGTSIATAFTNSANHYGIEGRGLGITGNESATAYGTGVVGMCGVGDFIHWNAGPGVCGTGRYRGVGGVAISSTGNRAGGYFSSNGGGTGRVAALIGGTHYKVEGTGTVSTVLPAEKEGYGRVYYAPEAPEIFFFDHGIAQLKKGTASISLDPILAFNIAVNETYPLHVFVQPHAGCPELYVSKETCYGFEVRSLTGSGEGTFSWWIVARRRDEYDAEGKRTSKNLGVRFSPADLKP
ncbi:MAG: hypothetical protein ACUVRD_07090 [Bacteroidia bacterium]